MIVIINVFPIHPSFVATVKLRIVVYGTVWPYGVT